MKNHEKARFKSGRLADHNYNRRLDNTVQVQGTIPKRKKIQKGTKLPDNFSERYKNYQRPFSTELVQSSEEDLETSVRPSYSLYTKPEMGHSEPELGHSDPVLSNFGPNTPEEILPFSERYTLDWISKPSAVYKDGMSKKTLSYNRDDLNRLSNPKTFSGIQNPFDLNYRDTWTSKPNNINPYLTLKIDRKMEQNRKMTHLDHPIEEHITNFNFNSNKRVPVPNQSEQNLDDEVRANQFQTQFKPKPQPGFKTRFRPRAHKDIRMNYQDHNNFDKAISNPGEANQDNGEIENKFQNVMNTKFKNYQNRSIKKNYHVLEQEDPKNQLKLHNEGSLYLPSRDALDPELSRFAELDLDENQIRDFENENSPVMTSHHLLTSGLNRFPVKKVENFNHNVSKASSP